MVLSLIVSYLLAFVPSAFAAANIGASQIEAPLIGPGSLFTVDITAANFVDLWYYSFTLSFDASILQAISATPVKGSPAFFTHTAALSIDNNAGTVTLAADRATRAGFTDVSGFQILIALIDFQAINRGLTSLHFSSAVFQDKLGGSIAVTPIDGFFDNRLQGTMSAPNMLDTGLVAAPWSFFDVFIGAADMLPAHPWGGYQFTLSFDPMMLVPVDAEILGGFDTSPVFLDIQMDHVTLVATGGNLAANDNIARLGFLAIENGTSQLLLSDVKAVDIYGHVLTLETNDGSFANVANISVSLSTIFVENRKWSVSMDGTSFALTAQVTNTGAGLTQARAHFVVFDRLGGVIADLTTGGVNMMPGTQTRISASLEVGPLATDALYIVEGSVEYVSSMGAWTQGHKGSPTGARMSMVKDFQLYP